MSDNRAAYNGGIGFCGALAITFIVLKLCGVIDWSWWWVLAPIWLPIALALGIMLIVLVFGLLAVCISSLMDLLSRRKSW